MEQWGNAVATGAAQRTGGEIASGLLGHWFMIAVVVIIVLIVLYPPEMFMSTLTDRSAAHVEGTWYGVENGAVREVEFTTSPLQMRVGDSEPALIEKPLIASWFYPRLTEKIHFKAMYKGKLRHFAVNVGDEQLTIAMGEKKNTYWRDRREAEALVD